MSTYAITTIFIDTLVFAWLSFSCLYFIPFSFFYLVNIWYVKNKSLAFIIILQQFSQFNSSFIQPITYIIQVTKTWLLTLTSIVELMPLSQTIFSDMVTHLVINSTKVAQYKSFSQIFVYSYIYGMSRPFHPTYNSMNLINMKISQFHQFR